MHMYTESRTNHDLKKFIYHTIQLRGMVSRQQTALQVQNELLEITIGSWTTLQSRLLYVCVYIYTCMYVYVYICIQSHAPIIFSRSSSCACRAVCWRDTTPWSCLVLRHLINCPRDAARAFAPPAWHASFICATWPIQMCDTTHSYVGHESFIHATWLIDECDMNHSYVRHDLFTCVTWLIHVCDMTHLVVWGHESFIRAAWLIYMCDVTYLYVGHESLPCATWLM